MKKKRDVNELVTFFYLLLRDYLSAGVVEKIVMDSTKHKSNILSNGYIGDYAEDIVKRLLK